MSVIMEKVRRAIDNYKKSVPEILEQAICDSSKYMEVLNVREEDFETLLAMQSKFFVSNPSADDLFDVAHQGDYPSSIEVDGERYVWFVQDTDLETHSKGKGRKTLLMVSDADGQNVNVIGREDNCIRVVPKEVRLKIMMELSK